MKVGGVPQRWLPTPLSAPARSGAETSTIGGTESFLHSCPPCVGFSGDTHSSLPGAGVGMCSCCCAKG